MSSKSGIGFGTVSKINRATCPSYPICAIGLPKLNKKQELTAVFYLMQSCQIFLFEFEQANPCRFKSNRVRLKDPAIVANR